MKVLILDTYYSSFLDAHYAANPSLRDASYSDQRSVLMDQCFGTADYYSENLRKLGHEAEEIVLNCAPMQTRWAVEHGVKPRRELTTRKIGSIRVPWLRRRLRASVIMEQIKVLRPDVLYTQCPQVHDSAFLKEAKCYVRCMVAQIASLYPPETDFRHYDFILSSFPHYVKRFTEQGLKAYYFQLAFESKVLTRLQPGERRDIVFVGGMSAVHGERIRFFEELVRLEPLDWWGYGLENLAPDSSLRPCYKGQAWGLPMYEKMLNARVTINQHPDMVVENHANNMRLYEATGVGTLLITDHKVNLADIFVPGKEVLAYRSAPECAELARYYLDHEEERKAIARAGQERTLREHTYFHRMQEFLDILKHHL
jgi:spore maturation protein CgeB